MNETQAGSAGAPDDGECHPGSSGNSSPFHARAAFLANWDRESAVRCNLRAREESWQLNYAREHTPTETLPRSCHRSATLLFFDRHTFADIAHYVAGVLDWDALVPIVGSFCRAATLNPGEGVQPLRGPASGVLSRGLDAGRFEWRPEGSPPGLIGLPKSFRRL